MSYSMTTPTADQVGVLHSGGTPVKVRYYGGSPTASGTLISAPSTDYQIVVLAMTLTNNSANAMTVSFQSTSTTTVTTANFSFPATIGTQITATCGACGIFACVPGEGLDIVVTGGAHAIGVTLTYVLARVESAI